MLKTIAEVKSLETVSPFKLTRARADEFHSRCPSRAARHTMGDYAHMLQDGKFDIGNYNGHWIEVYGRFGDRDSDHSEIESEIAAYLGRSACYF